MEYAKKGDMVVCIDNYGAETGLTVGQEYKVEHVATDLWSFPVYLIADNNGDVGFRIPTRFEIKST